MDNKLTRPFGRRDQIGYLSGSMANDLTFTLCSGFLMKFYTDVMDVSAAVVGIMMMLTQIIDAVTDVGMGTLVDRSVEQKDGKFRPWIRRIMGPVTLTSFLMYAVWFRDMAMGFKIVWMFVTYILYCSVFYTAVDIPYGSLSAGMSQNPNERASLANARHIGGTLAMTGINVIIPMVVYYSDAEGHQVLSGTRMAIAALVCSVAALILYIVCYRCTTERVHVPPTNEKFSIKKFAGNILLSRAMLGLVVFMLVRELTNTAFHGMSGYIYPNYFGNPAAQSISGVMETIITLVMAAFLVQLAARFGKREIVAYGSFFAAIVLLVAYFNHTHSVTMWLVYYGLITLGLGIFGIAWALPTDIIDDIEVRTGTRADGTIFGVYSFSRKLGQAISSGIRGIMLSAIGYTAATAFDPKVLDGIYNITCIVPMVGFAVNGLILLTIYPLSKKRVEENAEILRKRHAEAEGTSER